MIFGRSSWELYARAYVTADMMGIANEAHQAMMDKLWKEKKVMRTMEELAEFYSDFGTEPEKFISTSKSFTVDTKMRKDQQQAQEYQVRGTPTLVVNGKYRIAGSAAVPSYDVMLDVVDYLLAMEAPVTTNADNVTEAAAAEKAIETAEAAEVAEGETQ